jgi:hypothetical protein
MTDCSVPLKATEVDATTRGDGGWENSAPGVRSWGLTGKIMWVDPGTAYQAIAQLFVTQVATSATITGGFTSSNLVGKIRVVEFTEDQNHGDPVSATITLKGCGKPTSGFGSA